MQFKPLNIAGSYLITPLEFKDSRGIFDRIFCSDLFKKNNLLNNFKQLSICANNKSGTVRGLHFQKSPCAENKLVYCLEGNLFDVIVDLRNSSATFGQTQTINLLPNKQIIFIPAGCAHGYMTLADNTKLLYFTSTNYNPELATGIHWQSPELNLIWPSLKSILSENDQQWPEFSKSNNYE